MNVESKITRNRLRLREFIRELIPPVPDLEPHTMRSLKMCALQGL
jgi:hypothetical protein